MELSKHAIVRISERTRMAHQDVRRVIHAGAVVPLGMYRNAEYLLFYSPWDKGCRVAVVSENRQLIITILRVDERFPDALAKPTRAQEWLARNLLKDYLFTSLTILPPLPTPEEENRTPERLKLKQERKMQLCFQVMEGRVMEYEKELGEIIYQPFVARGSLVSQFSKEIRYIFTQIEALLGNEPRSIWYRFRFYSGGMEKFSDSMTHPALRKWLDTASL